MTQMIQIQIDELVRNFPQCVDYFYENCPFSFRQYYLHKKVIEKIRQGEHRNLFSDDHFLEGVHRTVSEWVGERGKGKLVDFATFRDRIKALTGELQKISDLRLHELDGEKWEQIKSDIEKLFKNVWDLELREGAESQIITVSKTLHHLLPDLIPPIDRKYTFKFFGLYYISKYQIPLSITSNKISKYKRDKETEQFTKVLAAFHDIARQRELTEKDLKREWDTSIPKLIDNAIVGHILEKKEE